MKSTGRMSGKQRDPETPASDHCADVCQGAEDREGDLPTTAGWYAACVEVCLERELGEDATLEPAIDRRYTDAHNAYWCESGMLRRAECGG